MWIVVVGLVVSIAGCEGDSSIQPTLAPSTLTWRELPAAPTKRTEVAAAAIGTQILVAGGYRADGATVATVEVFDTASQTWQRGPDLPAPVNHAMAATVAGAVMVFGGYDNAGNPSAGATRLSGTTWLSIAPMPEPRAAGAAAAVGTRVYIAGGIGSGKVLADHMLVYDTALNSWSTAPGPPTAREHLGGTAFGGRVFTVGGRTKAGNLDSFEVFDPAAGAWSALPPMPTPRGGMAAAATCSGWIVAVGGEAQSTFPEVEAFDTRAGRWQTLPKLPTPRHGLGVVTVGSTVYTLAGGPRPGLYVADTNEAIELAGLGPCA